MVAREAPTSSEEPKITPGTLTIHLHPEIVPKMDRMKTLVADLFDLVQHNVLYVRLFGGVSVWNLGSGWTP